MSSIRRGRWIAKKLARHGLAAGASALAPLGRAGPARVRAVTYHRFGDASRDPFCLPRPAFEAQMRWLAGRGLAVSLAHLEAFVAGEAALPEGAVLVTIDDGCRSVHREAFPVLRELAIPAVVYVPAGAVEAGADPDLDEPPMSWDQLAELAAAGVVVGSHAFHHRSMGRMGAAEARDEAVRSRELIERRLGRPATSFAYPFGTRADYGPETARALRQAGYRTAFTSQHGAIAAGMEALELPRVKIESGEAAWMFPRLCAGALDGWGLVDRGLWRLQR
jgi:peptidoglycan/xylan/chitin deacetylase (PgdA/CDA1 family)